MTIAPPPGTTATDHSTEQWLPNGFPPPSFVVEPERTSAFAGRGRWLAAAALLGAVLLIAGILLIARSNPDRTALRTDSSTTSTSVGDAVPFPSSSIAPTEGDPNAAVQPGVVVDPNAPAAPPAAEATTTTVAAAPAPGAPPPPPPGVLEAPGGITLLTAFTNRPPVTGSLTLRNSGPNPLTFGSDAGTGIAVNPTTGTIAPGATQPVSVTFTPGNLPETEPGKAYVGRVVFNGSGGSRTVEVRTVVARPPTIAPVGQGGKYVVSSDSNKTPCEVEWVVRANVADQPAGVRNVNVFISGSPNATPMVLETGNANAGFWKLDRPPAAKGLIITSIQAFDNHGAETVVKPNEVVCP